MQIQQPLGCHHLPISCIWFWWALMGCVSRWGRMSERCSGCHGQERASCVHVFPLCWLLEWRWPAKIKALLSLTGQRNWFWSWFILPFCKGWCNSQSNWSQMGWPTSYEDQSVCVSDTRFEAVFLLTAPFSSSTAISKPFSDLYYLLPALHETCHNPIHRA